MTQQNSSVKIQIGCGTLILIALIVLIFSGVGSESSDLSSLRNDIWSVSRKLDRIEQKLEELSQAIQQTTPTVQGVHQSDMRSVLDLKTVD